MTAHTALLLDNYRRCFGEDLIERGADEAERLMAVPFVVLSHGTQEDPVLNYGNLCGQKLFEMDWEALTKMPSRFTAESMHRDERTKLLNDVRTQGFSDNYRGIRISATGNRFYINSARIWMLLDAQGNVVGQAATFSDWELLGKAESGKQLSE
ncbi:MAG: MEKHLA domain-containing protein [Opitutaceae bacterium]